jgi:hypothetical protein
VKIYKEHFSLEFFEIFKCLKNTFQIKGAYSPGAKTPCPIITFCRHGTVIMFLFSLLYFTLIIKFMVQLTGKKNMVSRNTHADTMLWFDSGLLLQPAYTSFYAHAPKGLFGTAPLLQILRSDGARIS